MNVITALIITSFMSMGTPAAPATPPEQPSVTIVSVYGAGGILA